MPIVPFPGRHSHAPSSDRAQEVRLICRRILADIRFLAASNPQCPEESLEQIERISNWIHRLTLRPR